MDSAAERPGPADVRDALEGLEKASRIPVKQRQVKVSGVIDVICRHAIEDGLDADTIRVVARIASRKTELDQSSVTTLIKNLYPAQHIPADVVVTIVGALGQGKGKPSPGTQNGLVKWLVIVHEIIEKANVLSRLYGVLFGMLDMISIRTSLCHLLSLVTRRKHVKPFRIQQLLQLSRGLGNEPALQGLLRIYKDYYPDIILGTTSTSRKSFPPRPDPEWREKISSIQQRSTDQNGYADHQNGFKVLRKGPGRGKTSLIPDVHTYHATETSVTLEGIDNVDDFVEKLDRVEPPGQLISFLTDPLLQKYVELTSSEIFASRIELWLGTCLEEQYNATKTGTVDSRYLSEILEGLLKHTQYTKKLLPIVLTFLREYLPIWDGTTDVDTILGLLSFSPIQPFQEAHTSYLANLESALTSRNPHAYEKLMYFYQALLKHWINTATHQSPLPTHLPPNTSPSQTPTSTSDQKALADLTNHISTLSLSLLLSLPPHNPPNNPLLSAILTYYEYLSLSARPSHVPILVPPMHLLYHLLLIPSLTVISRTCGIIAALKTAYDTHPKPIGAYYPIAQTNIFNYCLRDLYNLLWLPRNLLVIENKARGLFCDPKLREKLHAYLSTTTTLGPSSSSSGNNNHNNSNRNNNNTPTTKPYTIHSAFTLPMNPTTARITDAAWRALEDREITEMGLNRETAKLHRGAPVSQRSLEALGREGGAKVGIEEVRVEVVRWLVGRGCPGIKEMMFATASNLRGR